VPHLSESLSLESRNDDLSRVPQLKELDFVAGGGGHGAVSAAMASRCRSGACGPAAPGADRRPAGRDRDVNLIIQAIEFRHRGGAM
jgi:hypothetical protein